MAETARVIRTPDQRLRVFVSSTLQEVAAERQAARQAIERLRLAPVMFELGARPHPPKDLYRAYLEQSHIFIGIYWQRYGWVAPDMDISGLEDEWRLSGDRPKLIYIKGPAPERESRLKDLIDQIRNDDHVSYKPFTTAEELRDLIENDLMLMLTERFEMSASTEAPTLPLPALPRSNLPVLSSRFIGRETELAELKRLLSEARLVTLIGPGGVGKTRLSLQLAHGILPDFGDGIWLVELAGLTDADLVPHTIAIALGVRESADRPLTATLIDYLRDKTALLILDNCEHVIEACARITTALLQACPNLRILASSRELLGTTDEVAFAVPTLGVPDTSHLPQLADLTQIEAVRLFVERARSAQPKFAVSEHNAAAIAQICQRLDGIPLAIELAAARVKVLSAEQIAARLDDSFRLLTGGSRTALPRQQTLRALIDWSYGLLAPAERTLFGRLAVFAGGWSLEAAEAVGAGGEIDAFDVLDLLMRLVDKSLVIKEEALGEARYRMLNTVGQYALEKLREADEESATRQRHLDYFVNLAETAKPRLLAADQISSLNRLEVDHDNLRSALEWTIASRSQTALRLAGALGRFWDIRSYFAEGRRLLNQALALRDGAPPLWQALALRWAGFLAARQGDYEYAKVLLNDSLALSRRHDDAAGVARALNFLGYTAFSQGKFDWAEELLQEALAINRSLNDESGLASTLNHLGSVAWLRGDAATARRDFEDSLTMRRKISDEIGVSKALYSLGGVAEAQGDYAAARRYLEESLTLTRMLGDRKLVAYTLAGLGEIAVEQGDLTAAQDYHAQALAAARELADKVGIAYALEGLGSDACALSDCEAARRYYAESLGIRSDIGDKDGLAACLQGFARAAVLQHQPHLALRLFAATAALRQQIGVSLMAGEQADFDQRVAELRAQFDSAAFEAEWSIGAAMTLEEAIACALNPLKE